MESKRRLTVKDGGLILYTEKAAEIQEEKNIRQMLSDAVDNLKSYKLAYPTKEAEIPFKEDEYYIPTPSASGEYRYNYSSESSANSAARKEFDRKMYSKIDSLILKVIKEYRAKYIKPYYSKDKTSVYAVHNKKLEEYLREICQTLKSEGLAGDLPDDFANVSVFPDENDRTWKKLNRGEMISDDMVYPIRREFKSNECTSLSFYENYWDTDYTEVYAGRGWFGGDNYEDKYCYGNLYSAFNELAKDILRACFLVFRYEDFVVDILKELVDQYNNNLENLINARIAYLEKKLGWQTFTVKIKMGKSA